MGEAIFQTEDYQRVYLPWANKLVKSKHSARLISLAQLDRNSATNSTVIFRPPMERLTAELALSQNEELEEQEETVKLVADFGPMELSSLAINSLKRYTVTLTPSSERWPVQYSDGTTRGKDLIVKREEPRERAERLVVRASDALLKHVVHRVPIGNIPENAIDCTIDEGEMRPGTIKFLRSAGINTYGELGILSLNQLRKIDGIGRTRMEDIKYDLRQLRWLSPAHEDSDF